MAYHSGMSLYRTQRGSMFGGVCAGLSEVFHIDVTLIRIIFAVAMFGFGSGAAVYIILWILLPER